MNIYSHTLTRCIIAISLFLTVTWAHSQENVIRKNLMERYSTLPPIGTISPTPVTGIFEVQIGGDIFYTDANADYIFQGNLIDARAKQNLTTLKKNMASQVSFASLPLKNAFTHVNGTGKRQLAVFVDPNCGFCKKLESDLLQLSDVTIHYILLPVLGEDSQKKSEHILCAKDKAVVWFDWMLKGVQPPAAQCEVKATIAQNLDFANQNRISGTPTMFLANGRRLVGALPLNRLDQLLNNPTAE
jgi:thiol:disulfide interchange protein DsbC